MAEKEFNELYEELAAAKSERVDLKPYQQSVNELYTQVKSLYETDRQGLPKLVDAQTLGSLTQAYRTCAERAEQCFAGLSETQRSALPEGKLVRRMGALLSRDLGALEQYGKRMGLPDAKQESLPTLIEKARSFTVDLSLSQIKAVGGQMSQRIPMELTVNGKQMRGMFTKATRLSIADDCRNAVEKAASQARTREGREAFAHLTENFRAYFTANRLDEQYDNLVLKNDDTDLATMARYVCCADDGAEELKKILSFQKGMKGSTATVSDKCGEPVISELSNTLHERFAASITYRESGIAQNARLDDRNAAMSKTASLLGLSHVICNAIPMRFLDEKGELVEGTFMEMARGVDSANPGTPFQSRLSAEKAFDKNKAVLRDLADLQALDYICGNTDRHSGNMIFSFDQGNPPQVTGVQGIDNDLSFGVKTLEKGHAKLASLDDMRVIGESTARKVEALTPAQLKLALREFSLSDAELDAAGKRLELLQKKLELSREHFRGKPEPKGRDDFQRGFIRVVPDDGFASLSLHDLEPEKGGAMLKGIRAGAKAAMNIFAYAITNITNIAKRIGKMLTAPQKLEQVASANRATRESAAIQNNAANRFAEQSIQLLQKSRPEAVKPLCGAIQRYQAFQNKLNERLKQDPEQPDSCFSASIMPNDLDQMRGLLGELRRESESYLKKAGGKDPFRKLASDVSMFAGKLTNIPPELEAEETKTALANERQATELFNREMSQLLQSDAAGLKKSNAEKAAENVRSL